MESQDSSTTSSPSQALQKALERQNRMKLGMWGTALQAIRDGLSLEQGMVRNHLKKGGANVPGDAQDGGEGMGDMYLGDVHQTVTAPQKSGIDFGKLLIGGGLLATGIGAPLGAYMVADAIKSQPEPPAKVSTGDVEYEGIRLRREIKDD